MRARRPFLLLAIVLPCLVLPMFAWAVQDSPSSTQRQPMRVTVDGSKNPELIPDRVAVGMFLSALAIPPNADKKRVALRDVMVKQVELSGSDAQILREELTPLYNRLLLQREAIEVARLEALRVKTPEAKASVSAAVEARDTLTWDSYTRLIETLSPAGAKKLMARVASIKKQMKGVEPAR